MSMHHDVVKEIFVESQRALQFEILNQLGALVSEGLLVAHYEGPILTHNPSLSGKYEFQIQQKVRLELKDQKVIDRKNREIEALKETVDRLHKAISLLSKWKES